MRSRTRGASLGTVLVCVMALTTILFIAVSSSITHLRVVTFAENQEHAKNLAESAIATAIDEMTQSGSQPGDISVSIPNVDGQGVLTFNSSNQPGAFSTYNIDGTASTSGARGSVVPARTAHLVGIGKVGSAQAFVECIYYRPPFPDGLLASGPVKASALKLYAIRRDDAYVGGDPEDISSENELPGNLFSNFGQGWSTGEPTAQISDNSDISGSLGSVGTIAVDNSSVVSGERLPGSESRPIPNLDIQAKINVLKPNAIPYSNSTLDPDWFVLSSSDLNITGDLDLNGSALLVEGDLTVQGAVLGTGVVLVEGDVTITDGGSDVTAGEQTAIACTGDFNLSANAPEGNYFKGLVYCEGDFLAKDITVVGATVVNAEDNPNARGQAELENVRFVYNPGSVEMSLVKPVIATSFKDGWNDGHHHGSINMIVRRGAGGQNWVCDISARLSRKPIGDETHIVGDFPTNPYDWQAASSGSPYFEQTWRDVEFSDDDPNSVSSIGTMVGNWMNENEDDNESVKKWDQIWAARLPTELTNLETEHVTFNLNNLLGELTATSRVLLWRPFPEQ